MRKLMLLLLVGTALAAKIPVSSKAVTKHYLNTEQRPTAGLASFYGRREQGKRMANGKLFDRNAYTCASLYYKLGTYLWVASPDTGAFVLVRVTDRGPWIKGRILDLSERAAKTLGIKGKGVAYVEIVPMKHLYVTKRFVMASDAAEALKLEASMPVHEVFRVEDTKAEKETKDAVGFAVVEPEHPYVPYDE